VEKICNCRDWDLNIKKLDGALEWAIIHGYNYDAKFFSHCPWCGFALTTKIEDDEKESE
jgi:hypothetical protein